MSIRGLILLVDDEEKLLKTLGRALRDEGHEVVATCQPREAQRLMAARSFDVLVVDNLMPGKPLNQDDLRFLQLFMNQAGMAIENSMLYNRIEDANRSLREAQERLIQGERLATIGEISDVFQVSQGHLMKVVHQLGRNGYIETVRGKGGGIRLGQAPEAIILGRVIRQTEVDLDLVECFGSESHCRIQPACRLRFI